MKTYVANRKLKPLDGRWGAFDRFFALTFDHQVLSELKEHRTLNHRT